MIGRDSADTSGYWPSYSALAFSAGARSLVGELLAAVDDVASTAPAASARSRTASQSPVASWPTSAARRTPRRRAPRSSSARRRRCRDRRCRRARLASPSVSFVMVVLGRAEWPARPASSAGWRRQLRRRRPSRRRPRAACRRRRPCRAARRGRLRSSAEPTTWAEPGGVRSTTRLPECATSTTQSPKHPAQVVLGARCSFGPYSGIGVDASRRRARAPSWRRGPRGRARPWPAWP